MIAGKSYDKWKVDLGGTNRQRTQRIAETYNLEVIYGRPDYLLLDIDSDEDVSVGYPFLDTTSRGGNKHRYVRLPREMEVCEQLEWHSKFGSDPKRDWHIRQQINKSHPIALFETKDEARRVREFMQKRFCDRCLREEAQSLRPDEYRAGHTYRYILGEYGPGTEGHLWAHDLCNACKNRLLDILSEFMKGDNK